MTEQEKIEQFIKKCRGKNLSVTPQRLAIYKALMTENNHPNPEAIFKKINADYPTISFATVYKTLETLEKNNIISLVTRLHNTVRYDPITEPHHHIICIGCQKVVDLFDRSLDQIIIPKSVTDKINVVNVSVHLNVICPDCLAD